MRVLLSMLVLRNWGNQIHMRAGIGWDEKLIIDLEWPKKIYWLAGTKKRILYRSVEDAFGTLSWSRCNEGAQSTLLSSKSWLGSPKQQYMAVTDSVCSFTLHATARVTLNRYLRSLYLKQSGNKHEYWCKLSGVMSARWMRASQTLLRFSLSSFALSPWWLMTAGRRKNLMPFLRLELLLQLTIAHITIFTVRCYWDTQKHTRYIRTLVHQRGGKDHVHGDVTSSAKVYKQYKTL